MKYMRSFLVALFVLVAPLAHAQVYNLPPGCYVTDANPFACHSIPDGAFLSWQKSLNQSLIGPIYGSSMAIVISRAYEHELDAIACGEAFNTLAAHFEATETNRQEWIAYATHQRKLVRKLKRACGTKCKKIR